MSHRNNKKLILQCTKDTWYLMNLSKESMLNEVCAIELLSKYQSLNSADDIEQIQRVLAWATENDCLLIKAKSLKILYFGKHGLTENYALVLGKLEEARILFKQLDEDLEATDTYLKIGRIYNQFDSQQALKIYFDCLDIARKNNYPSIAVDTFNYIAGYYFGENDLDNAIKYIIKCINLSIEENIKNILDVSYIGLSSCYIKQKKYAQAKDCLDQALLNLRPNNKIISLTSIYANYIRVFSYLGDYDNMLDCLKKLQVFLKSQELSYSIFSVQKALIDAYLITTKKANVAPKVLSAFQQLDIKQVVIEFGEKVLKSTNNFYKIESIEVLIMYHKYQGNLEQQVYFQEALIKLLSSKFLEDKKHLIERLTIKYELKEKEHQITIQKLEIKEKELEIQRRNHLKVINEKLEAKVLKRTQQLIRKNKQLEQFAHIIAHDLKEPLRNINGFTHILGKTLDKELLTSNVLDYMSFIDESTKKLHHLLEDLLLFCSIDSYIDGPKVMVDINQLLEKIKEKYTISLKQQNIQLSVEQMPTIKCSSYVLYLVFKNLIDNAIKFRDSNKNGFVQVKMIQEANQYIFGILDNGIGIEPQYEDKIFQIFQQLNKTTEGTGIGLALCKKIITAMGGDFWFASKFKEGSQFYFSLPILP